MIKVGLIGCGKIGQVRHLPEYAANQDCVITALYDINLYNVYLIISLSFLKK